MRKVICLLCVFAFIVPSAASAMELSAHSALLMDKNSGRVLFAHNAEEKLLIASTTKIMTGLMALQMAEANERVKIKKSYTLVEGTRVYFKEGDVLTVGELLTGLLLQSGNDAAIALADYCGRDEGIDGFVAAMNNMARQLGMKNSSFANPHGLNDDNNYSTAEDMAILTCAALSDPAFAAIVAKKTGVVGEITVRNHNKMLWNYEGATGVKTGYTKLAGRCLVSSAEREGQTLVAVTLNAPSDWNDHTMMLDYGFNTFPERRLTTAGTFICELPVVSGTAALVNVRVRDTLSRALSEAELKYVRAEVELPRFVFAPVEQGRTVGMIKYTLNGALIGQSELYADSMVTEMTAVKKSIWRQLLDVFS